MNIQNHSSEQSRSAIPAFAAMIHLAGTEVTPSHEDDDYDAWFRKQVQLGRLSAAREPLIPNAALERRSNRTGHAA